MIANRRVPIVCVCWATSIAVAISAEVAPPPGGAVRGPRDYLSSGPSVGAPGPSVPLAAPPSTVNDISPPANRVVTGPTPTPTEPFQYFDRAKLLFQREQYSEAITALNAALALSPRQADFYALRADSFFELGDFAAAIDDYTTTLSLAPNRALYLENRGECRRLAGDLAGALADIDTAIPLNRPTADARNAGLYFRRGLIHRASGELAVAIGDFGAAIALDGSRPAPYLECAFTERDSGNWAAAVGDFSKVIALESGAAAAYLGRGVAFERMGRWSEAQADYGQYARLRPGTDGAVIRARQAVTSETFRAPTMTAADSFERGNLRQTMGDSHGAVADFTQALLLDPTLTDALVLRALQWESDHKLWALASFSAALRLNPNHVLALQDRGVVERELGQLDAALTDLNAALALRPRDAWGWYYLAAAQRQKDDAGMAIASLNRAISLDPRVADFYHQRALCLFAQGRFDAAIDDNSLELDPTMVAAWNNRGLAHLRKGWLAPALADLTKALQLSPRNVQAYANRIEVYLQQTNLPAALADCNAILSLDPKNTDALIQRGTIRMRMGQGLAAESDFAQALALKPDLRAEIQAEKNRVAALPEPSQVVSTFKPVVPSGGMAAPTLPVSPAAPATAIVTTEKLPPPPVLTVQPALPALVPSPLPAAPSAIIAPAPIVVVTPAAPTVIERPLSADERAALLIRKLMSQANTSAQAGKLADALGYYNEVLTTDARHAEAYLQRGLVLIRLGRAAEAQADFDHFLSLQPDAKIRMESEIARTRTLAR